MMEGRSVTGAENRIPIDPTLYPEQSEPVASEALYDWLAGYGFARRYVEGKVVANIGRGGLGYGSHLLSQMAERVVGLTDSDEVADLASRVHPAPNVEYKRMESLTTPYPEGFFDVVVALDALGDLGPPGTLVDEAKRVLKRDGVLIVSTLDRRALLDNNPEGEGRRQGMYTPEFRALLGQRFKFVRVFRQGAVAGGFVIPEVGGTTGASVESAPTSAIVPSIGSEPPTTRSVLAVCFKTETPEGEDLAEQESPYLLLDRDRRVFDELGDLAEDVERLRSEIGRIQETEVQAFQDSYRLLGSEIAFLRAQVRSSEARARQIEKRAQAAERRIRDMENSATWRVFEPYRQLRIRLDTIMKGKRDKQ
jgi:SAM-dependent methyltransferase